MRIPTRAIGVLAAAALVGGCAADEPDTPLPSLYPKGTPLWKQLPDKPAGPRPAPVVGERRSFGLQRVAAGLVMPNQVVARPGDDRLYVVEQGGTVRILDPAGAVAPRAFADVRHRTKAGGERGLLSLAFSPDGRTAHLLLTDRRGDTRVLALPAGRDRADASRARVLLALDQPYENHNGGTLLVDERGRLVLGLGDGGSAFDPAQRSQDPDERLGKVLRHDGRGWETVATGLRNPFRMSFDRRTGRLWVGDVGQDRVEEVDALFLPEEGAPTPNLGWAAYEGHLPLGRKQLAGTRNLVWPVTSYLHREGHCSITGGYVARGEAVPRLRGRYVFGDFCRGTMWSLRAAAAEDPGRADVRREAARLPGLVSFGEARDGTLYAVSIQGSVHRLVPAGTGTPTS